MCVLLRTTLSATVRKEYARRFQLTTKSEADTAKLEGILKFLHMD
jgi:hypothetical protein